MLISRAYRLALSLFAVAVLCSASLAQAQTTTPPFYPLEITNIGPIGANGLNGNNRIFRAYPGLEYNIRAAVVGGVYPFRYSLANAPSGMTINADTGEIVWPNPQASASNITLTVRDTAGATRSATWSITVTTNGFKFLDAVNGRNAANNGCSSSCGTGTLSNPWRTLGDLSLNDAAADITYFKNGTYSVLDTPDSVRSGRVIFSDRPGATVPGSVMWIAFPGHQPRLDFGYRAGVSDGHTLRHNGDNVYIDGFEGVYSRHVALQFEPTSNFRGGTYRRLRMHELGPGGDGTNSAYIMSVSTYPYVSYGMVIQDSSFYDLRINDSDAACTLKIYSQQKILIEDTVQYNGIKATELKADVRQFTVRNNTFYNLTGTAIGGNMHGCVGCSGGSDSYTTGGEILFNNVRGPGQALEINQDGFAIRTHIHRNTFRGRVGVVRTDSADGPFYFSNNVIVSNDAGTPSGSHIYHFEVSDPSRIVLSNNLVGYPSDNIIDSNGNLTSGYSQYYGTHGYQHSGGGTTPPPPTPPPAPAAPSNVRIVR
jgi:hypothetical protein